VSDEDTITEKEIDDLVDAEDLSEMPDEDDDKKENPFAKKKDKKKDDDEDDEDDKDMDDDKKESTMTKAEMIEELSAKMEGLKKGNVRKAYEALMSALDTEEDVEEVIESRFNRDELVIDVTQDVAALLSGEDLSEDFERKAATIFQAAVTDKVEKEINKLDAKFDKMVTEEVSKIHTSLSTQVDEYMTYVSEEWMKENELAIETGIRTELTEDFISGLKSLFEKNYIDIPEDKVDVVEELTNKVEELEATLNEQMEKNIELSKDNDTKDRVTIVSEVCDGLADTEAEKIAGLSENVSYTDAESFKDSISTLRESYFPKSTVQEEVEPEVLSESADSENTVISDEAVSAAVTALNRTVR
jgi:hypothetical protein